MGKLYNKGFLDGTDYYYIHRHKDNIGRAYNGDALTDSQIAKIYTAHKDKANQAVLKQYSTLMLENIKYNGNLDNLIETHFKGQENFLNTLNSQMREQLNEALDIGALRKLQDIEHKTTRNDDITNLIKNSLQSDSLTVKGFDDLLTQLEEVCNLMDTDGAALAAIISDARTKGLSSRAGGVYLNQALANFRQQSGLIKSEAVDRVVTGITRISTILANPEGFTKTTSSGGATIKNFKTLLENTVFSTDFAEAFSSRMTKAAQQSMNDVVVSLTGTGLEQIQIYDAQGNRINQKTGNASYGKSDVRFKNFHVNLTESGTDTTYNLDVDLGLSVKFYASKDFARIGQTHGNGEYSSGSGGSLQLALDMLFADTYHKYLASNVLARGVNGYGSMPAATVALQDLIARRQLVNLFGARGLTDFSQFFFANGQLVALGDIINYALNTDLGKSASMGGDTAIVITIDGREGILGHLNKQPMARAQGVHQGINSAVVKAKLHLHKLTKGMVSSPLR